MRASMSTRSSSRSADAETSREHSRRDPARPHDAGLPGGDRRRHAPSPLQADPPGPCSRPSTASRSCGRCWRSATTRCPSSASPRSSPAWCWRCRAIPASPASPPKSAIPNVVVVSLTRELGPGAGRPDGRRPGRRRDGGRDRHHAGHRADRRADHAVDRPVQVPGGAAPDRRHRHPAGPGADRRHHRRAGRLPGRRLQARLQRRRLPAQHASTSCSSRTSSPAW